MGLKRQQRKQSSNLKRSSNRTIVGLKPLSGLCALFRPSRSNRTIVGLKPLQTSLRCPLITSSNRTIVGLKPCQHARREQLTEQQSHHCGIETHSFLWGDGHASKAAIAPLWD